jgi:hypothetical protein
MHITTLPNISLSNLKNIFFDWHNDEISTFDMFLQSILKNCEYLETITICKIEKFPNIVQHIQTNYANNCLVSGYDKATKIFPVKIGIFRNIDNVLKHCQYLSELKTICIRVDDFNKPYVNGLRNYKNLVDLCPNVNNIEIWNDNNIFLQEIMPQLLPENQNIWKERISYFKEKQLKVIKNRDESLMVSDDTRKTMKHKWGLVFMK